MGGRLHILSPPLSPSHFCRDFSGTGKIYRERVERERGPKNLERERENSQSVSAPKPNPGVVWLALWGVEIPRILCSIQFRQSTRDSSCSHINAVFPFTKSNIFFSAFSSSFISRFSEVTIPVRFRNSLPLSSIIHRRCEFRNQR